MMFKKPLVKMSIATRIDQDIVELAKLYPPKPASESRSWWNKMKSYYFVPRSIKDQQVVEDKYDTFKYCPGVFDFTNSGYMVQWVHDIEFFIDKDGVISWKLPELIPPTWIEIHNKRQIEGCPFHDGSGGDSIIKVITPFLIDTPKGWSTMFCKPYYSYNSDFDQCWGILDTDQKHYSCHSINVFFRFNVRNKLINFKAGDPMIQLIPFKRIPTKLEFSEKPSKEIQKQQQHRIITSRSRFGGNSEINGKTLLKYREAKTYE